MEDKITFKDVILELTPFSQDLIDWSKKHIEFSDALKNIYPEKFISPGIVITHPPIRTGNAIGDEVIGVYIYHYNLRTPIFKQDFIVKRDYEYTLYSRNPGGNSEYVKDINEFYLKYSIYGHDKRNHHSSLEELPPKVQERAKEAMVLAGKMKIGTPQEIPQKHIDKIYKKVMAIPREERIVIKKLA
jgi:hypothetical protein